MFTVENSILLPAPLARVWRLVFDVNRYRDWHPDIGLESDPNDPKKLIYTYWRPGWADPIISVEGSIVRLKRPSEFAWRVGIRWLFEIEEGFHLEKAPQGTRLTHRLSCSGIGSWFGFLLMKPFLRRRLAGTDGSLERYLRRGTVISRYSHRNPRHH
ncbi:MAG TPA: SRPBCC family protein [Rhizorhapis sp.]|uniref:SRPBCC family protein n=1 Tax=Sphingopyxis sp. SCN 67-31 TaxID=1660142 RepID=UPI000869AB53|nr:SRPBCC family protein [Sphingopyxis sp. SCN 67-31]ODU26909.1 MAG: hypothetical protein ABS88_17065 [Sphingopyxis sp. SCN 67-31]